MTKRQRILLLSSIGLLLSAIVLLSLNRWVTSSSARKKLTQGEPRLEWQAFPTRDTVDTPELHVEDYVTIIRQSILSGDFAAANSLVDEAEQLYPDDIQILQQKTRLAVAQEQYDIAEELIRQVIGLDPKDAMNWALASLIYKHIDEPELENQSISAALQLDPQLAPYLFQERWQFAFSAKDGEKLTQLADEYFILHPDDVLADYYFAEALRVSNQNNIALILLNNRLSANSHAPSILWYTLGLAYLDRGNYVEAATALEYAQELYKSGDNTISISTDEIENALKFNLARAYLGSECCVFAEALFNQLATNSETNEYSEWISKAVTCQTPTPTPTHWMLSFQSTTTPSPY